MKKVNLVFYSIIIIISIPFICSAAKISGKVVNEQKKPLSFTNVFLKNTTIGTTTNEDGFFTLDLKPGKYTLAFKQLGYKIRYENIVVVDKQLSINVQLTPEEIVLPAVIVSTKAEDPAYAIIRDAIKKREFYLNQVKSYTCDVYIKGVQKITKKPKKLFGIDLDPEGEIDSVTGIVYLSESVSKFSYLRPNKRKELMISSKVSGDNKAFSYNQSTDMMFNFYESIIEVEGLSERGFVSPIANSAFLYYKYKLIGSYIENNLLIHKIEVLPKRDSDPIFHGFIYIVDESWRIYSTDLFLTKDSRIDFVDTLLITQSYLPVEKDIWLVFSNKFSFAFSIMGIHGYGMFLNINSNHIIDPEFPENYFGTEVMKINEDANKKDTTYWKETRPIPLTDIEQNDYRKRDSIQNYKQSKRYLDSVDNKANKIGFGKLFITGYDYSNRATKQNFSFSPMIANIQFNTVQGLVLGIKCSHRKKYNDYNYYRNKFSFSYGFSNKKLNFDYKFTNSYKPEKFTNYSIFFGHSAKQYNENNPISVLINELYTLLNEDNYLKLYQKTYFGLKYNTELINGVIFNTTAEYANREALTNKSNYKLIDIKNKEYTSNNPLNHTNDIPAFTENQILNASFNFNINFKQQYYTRPHEKVIIGSKYPTLNINYKKAIKGVAGTDVGYDLIKFTATDEFNLKLFGRSSYNVSYGKFFNQKNMQFTDYYHFTGNKTIYSNFDLNEFRLLDYYKFSTNKEFVEGHFQHAFGGFILNKFPLIKKLKISEVAGIHYLTTDYKNNYYELYIGLEKFRIFRVEWVNSFENGKHKMQGILVGFKIGSNGAIRIENGD